jgi:hypothetical protein
MAVDREIAPFDTKDLVLEDKVGATVQPLAGFFLHDIVFDLLLGPEYCHSLKSLLFG